MYTDNASAKAEAAENGMTTNSLVVAATATAAAVSITKTDKIKKKKILTNLEYTRICYFIQHYHGLAIDCELEMVQSLFVDIERHTLKSILQTELNNRLRAQHWRFETRGKKHLKTFEEQSAQTNDNTLLIKIANLEGMCPVVLCRGLLQEKYHFDNKSQLARLMKYPHLIDDPKLSANVIQCLCSDSQDGPLIDLRRRVVGEEYEFKLKQLAQAAGMHYYDENDLRRMGYDKTPDIKMILPFLYKGEAVHWIESKATFGDVKTHKWYIHQQLNSYSNRFGHGIVIYWFGYHEDTPKCAENSVGITVLADFPTAEHLTFLNLTGHIDAVVSLTTLEDL